MPEPPAAGFLLLIGLPLAGAILAAALRGRASDAAAVLAALAGAIAACALVVRHGIAGVTVPLGGLPVLDRMAGHAVPLFGFTLDPLSSVVLLGSTVLGFVCVLYSVAYVAPQNRETPAAGGPRGVWLWMLL
jgi:NADH:ubiquinone oxidoreductase subunit 5 (subunit L)/multisubunit Na+/H+ antiporter MnhA subunit